jgi:hypothetical protein
MLTYRGFTRKNSVKLLDIYVVFHIIFVSNNLYMNANLLKISWHYLKHIDLGTRLYNLLKQTHAIFHVKSCLYMTNPYLYGKLLLP